MVWRLGGGRRLRGKPTAMTIWVPVQPSWRTVPCELGLASVDDPRPLTPADTLMPQYRNDLALLPARWCQAPRVRVNASACRTGSWGVAEQVDRLNHPQAIGLGDRGECLDG